MTLEQKRMLYNKLKIARLALRRVSQANNVNIVSFDEDDISHIMHLMSFDLDPLRNYRNENGEYDANKYDKVHNKERS